MFSRSLEFENLYYTYPGSHQRAIEGLTMAIPAGEKSVILGHNGSGKSTLLFLADGLYQPEQGMIRWCGEPLDYQRVALDRWRHKIGLAFQDPEQQLVAGTVAEDISYGLCNLRLSSREIARRLERTIADFHLQALRDFPLHHLSLGQKRRVALAGVMALEPELLLLDEPTAYLDRLQTRHLLRELERVHQQGTTIILATHDLDFAYAWGDYFWVLDRGQLVMEGRAEAIFRQRERLEALELGLPLLWEVWEALCKRDGVPSPESYPRSIEALQQFMIRDI
jgi:cobalt/nickel transport system ATP-binding protein